MPTMTLSSPAFVAAGSIPVRFTCDGVDVSPALAWSGSPSGTAAYALIVTRTPAASSTGSPLDLPADRLALDEGASGAGGFAEGNDPFRPAWPGVGLRPPSGTHRYVFELFALDRALGLAGQPRAAEVRRALDGHVLASGRLVGTYRRG